MITHFFISIKCVYLYQYKSRLILRGLTIPKKQTININNYMGISFQKELKRIAFKQGD